MRTRWVLSRYWLSVCAAVMLVLAPGRAWSAPASALVTSAVTAQLSGVPATYSGSGPLNVVVTFTNHTSSPLAIPRWLTPFAGLDSDMFVIERDGQRLPYLGALLKRGTATASDVLVLGAGARASTTLDVSQGYDVAKVGRYVVRLETNVAALDLSAFAISAAALPQGSSIASNPVSFDVSQPGPPRALGLVVARPVAGGGTPTFNACNATEQAQITTALDNAASISTARAQLLGNPSAALSLYTKWFGAYSNANYTTIQNHMNAISTALSDGAIGANGVTFDCSAPPPCTANTFAWVAPSVPFVIHLCAQFWLAPSVGIDSKMGTLVHETSHFTAVAGTADNAYGQAACLALALSNPAQAINNADSHEYFVESRVPVPALPLQGVLALGSGVFAMGFVALRQRRVARPRAL